MSIPLFESGNGFQWGSFFLNSGETFNGADLLTDPQEFLQDLVPCSVTLPDHSSSIVPTPTPLDVYNSSAFYPCQCSLLPLDLSFMPSLSDYSLQSSSTNIHQGEPHPSTCTPILTESYVDDLWKECMEKKPIQSKKAPTTKRKRVENDWILFKKYYTEKVKSERGSGDIKKGDLSARAVRNAWRVASKEVKSEIQKQVVRKRMFMSLHSIENEYDKYKAAG